MEAWRSLASPSMITNARSKHVQYQEISDSLARTTRARRLFRLRTGATLCKNLQEPPSSLSAAPDAAVPCEAGDSLVFR